MFVCGCSRCLSHNHLSILRLPACLPAQPTSGFRYSYFDTLLGDHAEAAVVISTSNMVGTNCSGMQALLYSNTVYAPPPPPPTPASTPRSPACVLTHAGSRHRPPPRSSSISPPTRRCGHSLVVRMTHDRVRLPAECTARGTRQLLPLGGQHRQRRQPDCFHQRVSPRRRSARMCLLVCWWCRRSARNRPPSRWRTWRRPCLSSRCRLTRSMCI